MDKIIATGLGIGYMGRGSGTIAAALSAGVWYTIGGGNSSIQLVVTIVIVLIGIWSATSVERIWGVDSNKVVVDEIAGMCISLLFLPATLIITCSGLVLFRFFDILKPFYIRKAENLPAGWGVMADDILAGIYTNILLQIAVQLHWF
ncbi:phosphatidylglycerophosphatase A family protein [Chryseosolibacter indicus]|uniref:Phosphatidylglycerophosphatase A n=1 Tax=Chryseosolibacter indicus TaxID=2782351 RepID=A0ABS5VSS7_9BACT|nr:phosphatidylglycerophosphatase A [Chryseosolibacter indicus]MBT1704485.1 phosphatidylglycerophosphatase A [Chryseosolibacter indicus]